MRKPRDATWLELAECQLGKPLRRSGRSPIFAFVEHERTPVRITLKCDREYGEPLRAEHAAIDRRYPMDKRHWISITLDGSVPRALMAELIEDSYDLVAPRRRNVTP